ncbi:MAG: hypothetical protein K6G73_07890 [Marinilabiliaceae bacterium]|nr:hypothetical protein [Marinilabiliaceae bacterium]
MKQLLSVIISTLLVCTSCSQEVDVTANFSASIFNDSTLLMKVELCNNSDKKIYLTCGDPCVFDEQGDGRCIIRPCVPLDSSLIVLCNSAFDTINMSFPIIKETERYQRSISGDTIDMYYLFTRLSMASEYKYMNTHPVPAPPNDQDSLWFCDYNFLKLCRDVNKDWTDIVESGISEYIILLNPYERRVFCCNMKFWLPLKAIFKLQLSLEYNDTLHCQFLDSLGYYRYDKEITSKPIIIDNTK